MLIFAYFFSDDVRDLTFTVIVDMRGSTWNTVKPILKVLQEFFANQIHTAFIIKPDGFWQKQRTSLGSQKYKFEVKIHLRVVILIKYFNSNFRLLRSALTPS